MRIKFLQAGWRLLRDAIAVAQCQYTSPFSERLEERSKGSQLSEAAEQRKVLEISSKS